MDTLTQLGIGGLLVVLVLREVFGFLRAHRNGRRCLTTAKHDWLKKTHERSERLDRLHAPTDDDGIPLWYLPRSWGKTQVEIVKVQRQILDNQRRCAAPGWMRRPADASKPARLIQAQPRIMGLWSTPSVETG